MPGGAAKDWEARARVAPEQLRAVSGFGVLHRQECLGFDAAREAGRAVARAACREHGAADDGADEAAAAADDDDARGLDALLFRDDADEELLGAAGPRAALARVAGRGSAAATPCSDEERRARAEAEAYRELVQGYERRLQGMLAAFDEIGRLLGEVEQQHGTVESKTEEVRLECQSLLRQQQELQAAAAGLRSRLSFFDEADRMAARLSTAGGKLVVSQEFGSVLERLERCLSFMEEHSDFCEAPRYLAVFRQLHLKVLNAVKAHFTDSLHAAAQHVQAEREQHLGAPLYSAAGSALAFVEFRAVAQGVRPLMANVESRAEASKPYTTLLTQCLQTYYFQRDALLRDDVRSYLDGLSKSHNLEDLIRASSSYLVELCTLEYQLFQDFFAPSPLADSLLGEILASLSDTLHTQLRPVVIQEHDLDSLCHAILILRTEVLEEQVAPRGDSLAPLGAALRRLVQDMQERLAYLSQRFVRDRIELFRPGAADLDYPARLGQGGGGGGGGQDDGGGPASMYDTWYPPLERTLMCLSKLYNRLEPSVFQYMAQHAMSVCTSSLVAASRRVAAAHGERHGQLFLVKHLLTLREQIAPFEVEFAVTERKLDLSHMRGLASGLLHAGSSWRSLVAAVQRSEPKLVEGRADSRKDMEHELKSVCEQFIAAETAAAARETAGLLSRYAAVADPAGAGAAGGAAQAGSDTVARARADTQAALAALSDPAGGLVARLQELRGALALYLGNPVTEKILFKPVQSNVHDAVQRLRLFCGRLFVPRDEAVAAQVDALESATLSLLD